MSFNLRALLVHQEVQDQRYFLFLYFFFFFGVNSCFIVNEILNQNLSLQGNMGLNFQGPKGEKVSEKGIIQP